MSTITRTVKYCIDTAALTAHQRDLFARHAGTHRAVWNWALALTNDRKRLLDKHVRQQAAAATDGTDEAIAALYADKAWRTAAYKATEAAHPAAFKYNAAGFGKEFTRLARSGEVYGETKDGSPRSFGWWNVEDHGVNRFAVSKPLEDLDTALKDFYSGKAKRGQQRRARKDGMPAAWPTFKKVTDPAQFRMSNLSLGPYVDGPDGKKVQHPLPGKILNSRGGGSHRLRFPNLGDIRVHNDITRLRRYISKGGTPKTAQFTQAGGRWYVAITISFDADSPYVAPRPTSRKQKQRGIIGVDLGVALLAATSDGETFDRLAPARATHKKMVKAQRDVSRGVRGSNRNKRAQQRVARLHHKVALQRANAQHHLTKHLTTTAEVLVIEDLKVTNMTKSARGTTDAPGRNVRAKSGLNRSILDVGFAEIRRQLEYKTLRYGSTVAAVNPANTSRTCSNPDCGHVAKENRKSQAVFKCVKCGHQANADVNAAIIIKNRYPGTPGTEDHPVLNPKSASRSKGHAEPDRHPPAPAGNVHSTALKREGNPTHGEPKRARSSGSRSSTAA